MFLSFWGACYLRWLGPHDICDPPLIFALLALLAQLPFSIQKVIRCRKQLGSRYHASGANLCSIAVKYAKQTDISVEAVGVYVRSIRAMAATNALRTLQIAEAGYVSSRNITAEVRLASTARSSFDRLACI
jgi:hypothetical protein